MKYLLSLFLCLTASAQLPVIPFVMQSSGLPDPSTISGIRYWWHSADNPLNVNVTNWVDRIQGNILTNGSNSLRPTNSSTGVGFNGSTWLTNTVNFNIVTIGNGTGSVYIVCSPITVGSLGGIIGDTTPGGNAIYEASGSQMQYFGAGGSGVICNFASGTTTFDLAMVITNTATGRNLFYTNNVFINNNAGLGEGTHQQKYVGNDGSQVRQCKGKVLDIIFFYGKLTTQDLTTLHTWATNSYGFSP